MPSSKAELEGKECYECGSKNIIQVIQGRFRKYGYCKKHSNSSYPNDVRDLKLTKGAHNRGGRIKLTRGRIRPESKRTLSMITIEKRENNYGIPTLTSKDRRGLRKEARLLNEFLREEIPAITYETLLSLMLRDEECRRIARYKLVAYEL